MRSIPILILVTSLAVPAVVSAQPAGPPHPHGEWGPPHRPGGDPARFADEEAIERSEARRLAVLTDYLDLSDAQQLEIEAILDQARRERRATLEAMRATGDDLRLLLEADSPDPARVGELVIALDRSKKTLGAMRRAESERIATVLTPEQQERYEALETARHLRPRPAGPRLHGGPGRTAPPGGPDSLSGTP